MYGMLIAWGQWIVALVVTGALLVRTPHSPNDYQHISPKIISLTLCTFFEEVCVLYWEMMHKYGIFYKFDFCVFMHRDKASIQPS